MIGSQVKIKILQNLQIALYIYIKYEKVFIKINSH